MTDRLRGAALLQTELHHAPALPCSQALAFLATLDALTALLTTLGMLTALLTTLVPPSRSRGAARGCSTADAASRPLGSQRSRSGIRDGFGSFPTTRPRSDGPLLAVSLR